MGSTFPILILRQMVHVLMTPRPLRMLLIVAGGRVAVGLDPLILPHVTSR